MIIGVIGAGNIGQAVATNALRAGHTVVISNSRGPASLAEVVTELGDGARAGSVAEASQQELVVLAEPWTKIGDATAGLGGRTSGQVVAGMLKGARVVKAANTLGAAMLAADPHQGDGRRVLVLSGDDIDDKGSVAALFEAAGFATIDLGGLEDGGRLQDVGTGVFSGRNLVQFS